MLDGIVIDSHEGDDRMLLTRESIDDLVDRMSTCFPNDWSDMVLENDGQALLWCKKSPLTLGLLSHISQTFLVNCPDRAIIIDGLILLTDYEVLDVNTINIHCMDYMEL